MSQNTVTITEESLRVLVEEAEDTLTAISDPAYDKSHIEQAVEEGYAALSEQEQTEGVVAIVDVEPDWTGVYVDGELVEEGHTYHKTQMLTRVINDLDVYSTENYHFESPDPWKGLPEQFENLTDTYPQWDVSPYPQWGDSE